MHHGLAKLFPLLGVPFSRPATVREMNARRFEFADSANVIARPTAPR